MICCRFVGRSISHGWGERQAIENAGPESADVDLRALAASGAGDAALATAE
jgi:hypothetical protein